MTDPALSLVQFASHYDSKSFTRAQNNDRRDPNRVNNIIYRTHSTRDFMIECSAVNSISRLVAALTFFGLECSDIPSISLSGNH